MSLQEFYDTLARQDWFYFMADDRRTEAKGKAALDRCAELARQTSPEHHALFVAYRDAMWSHGSIAKPPRPENV